MKEVFVVDAVRTPIGKYGGALSNTRPDDMAAHVMRALLARHPNFDINEIEDVILGAANQSGEDNRNVARMALLLAGLSIKTGGYTVNRLCASGLQSIMDATRAIICNEGHAYLAGGVESMSRAPFVMPKATSAFERAPLVYDTTMGWRFTNPRLKDLYGVDTMGETAENVAKQWNISREAQDAFAFDTQQKYHHAHEKNKFQNEIVPIEVRNGKDLSVFDKDEFPRLSSLEKLAELKAAFISGGTVTAGNSSGINDGAACLLLVNEEMLKRYNLTPLAKVKSFAISGVEPRIMGIGPVSATQKALGRAGLQMNDIDLIELNEAFASQALACMQELSLDPSKVNVNGGSIAIGHPLGASGSRISATLLHEMQKRENVKYGLATMCIGVGQGAAIIFEKC
jgi:acetyl-CoA C-acetyltransferase